MQSKPKSVKRLVPDLQNTISYFMIPQNQRKRSQMEQLLQLIKQVPFFQKYIDNGWEKVCQQCLELMTYESFDADKDIFAQGTIGESFYVIIEGQVGVFVNIVGNLEDNKIVPSTVNILPQDMEPPKDSENPEGEQINQDPPKVQKLVKVLESGDSFGELSLIYNRPRLATIKTLEKTHLAVLNKKDFRAILREKEEQQLVKEMNYFTTLPFFEGQNFNLVRDIYLNSFQIKVANNEIIFNEGDPSDSVYIIKSGEFVFCHQENDQHQMNKDIISPEINIYYRNANKQDKKFKQMTLTMLGNKELFGEENLLMSENRTFGVKCQSVTGELLLIKRDQFLNKVMSDTNTCKYIKERCQKKLQNMKKRIENIEGQLNAFSSYLVGDDRKIKLRRNMESMTNADVHFLQKSRDISLDQIDETQYIYSKAISSNNQASKNKLSRANTKNFNQVHSPDSSFTQLNVPTNALNSRKASDGSANPYSSSKKQDGQFFNSDVIDEDELVETCLQVMKQDSALFPNKQEKLKILQSMAQEIEQKNQYIKLNNTYNLAQPNTQPQTQQIQDQPQPRYDPQIDPLRDQLQVKMNVLQYQQKNMKIQKLEETTFSGQTTHEEFSEKLKNLRIPNKKYIDYLKESKVQNGSLTEMQSSQIKNIMSRIKKHKNEQGQDTTKLDHGQVKFLNQVKSLQNIPHISESKNFIQSMVSQTEQFWPTTSSTQISYRKPISRINSAQFDTQSMFQSTYKMDSKFNSPQLKYDSPIKLDSAIKLDSTTKFESQTKIESPQKLDSPIKLKGGSIQSSGKKSILKNSRPQSSSILFNPRQKMSIVKNPNSDQKGSLQRIDFNLDNQEKGPIINIRPLSGRAHFIQSLPNLNNSDQDSIEDLSEPTSPSNLDSYRGDTLTVTTQQNGNISGIKKLSTDFSSHSSPLKQQRINSAISLTASQKNGNFSIINHLKPPSSSQFSVDNYFLGSDTTSKRQSEEQHSQVYAPIVSLSTQQRMYSVQLSQKPQSNYQPAPQTQLVSSHLAFKPKMQMRCQSSKGYRNPQQTQQQRNSKVEVYFKSEHDLQPRQSQTENNNVSVFRPFTAKDKNSTSSGSTLFFKNPNSSNNLKIKTKKVSNQTPQKQATQNQSNGNNPQNKNLYFQNETHVANSNQPNIIILK